VAKALFIFFENLWELVKNVPLDGRNTLHSSDDSFNAHYYVVVE